MHTMLVCCGRYVFRAVYAHCPTHTYILLLTSSDESLGAKLILLFSNRKQTLMYQIIQQRKTNTDISIKYMYANNEKVYIPDSKISTNYDTLCNHKFCWKEHIKQVPAELTKSGVLIF